MRVISACVKGASHKRSGKPCQDSIKVNRTSKQAVTLIAAADGHGSAHSPYSEEGSKIAADTFQTVMSRYFRKHKNALDKLNTFLHREGDTTVAKEIEKEWKKRVRKKHRFSRRPESEISSPDFYRRYGSTLLGLLITSSFYFAFQLGDGDILLLTADSAEHIIKGTVQLGVDTYSLCQDEAWRRVVTTVGRRSDTAEPHAFMLATDGFSNSYPDEELFLRACREYYSAIEEHGANTVWGSLSDWLSETSEKGSGDDISVLIACNNDL
jgi:serine/threonine protein phosphatase PrpC